MKKKYAMYIGRWQPFHNGHDYIIRKALDSGKNVLIAVRDTPITEKDPYSAEERVKMIEEHYKGESVEVVVIPDIESVNIGRAVGYEVVQYDAPENVEGISATEVRRLMAIGNDKWKEKVPTSVARHLEKATKGMVVWFTGLSGSGKSTLAEKVVKELHKKGKKVKVLDGDEVRTNLTEDLGFSKEDRDENIKRIGFVAKSVADVGGIAIVAAISPYEEARKKVREMVGNDRFFLVHVDCDIETLTSRDVKGLYKKAIAGEIENFTGISDPYERPKRVDCTVNSKDMTEQEALDAIMNLLNRRL
jgi:adenylylsulfate kinase